MRLGCRWNSARTVRALLLPLAAVGSGAALAEYKLEVCNPYYIPAQPQDQNAYVTANWAVSGQENYGLSGLKVYLDEHFAAFYRIAENGNIFIRMRPQTRPSTLRVCLEPQSERPNCQTLKLIDAPPQISHPPSR